MYERGGLNTDLLGESERAEVDEGYAVCKRELNRCKDKIHMMNMGNCHA